MTLNIKKISAETAWIFLGQLMVVAGSIFGIRVLTYLLSPSTYGNLAIGMTAVVLVQEIILNPLGHSFLRYFSSAYEDKQLSVYFKTVRFLLTRATVLVVVVAVISVIGLFLTGNTKWIGLFSLAFLYALFSGYNVVLNYIQNAARQRKVVALHQGIGQWLRFLIPVGLIGLWGADSFVVMFGYVIAALIILISQVMFLKKNFITLITTTIEKVPIDVLNKYGRKIFAYAWPFATWGLFTWAQFVSSRWALLSFATIRDVGFYSVLYQFGCYPIIVVSGAVSQVLTPVLFSRAGSGDDLTRVTNTIRLNYGLILAAGIVTVMFVAGSYMFHKKIFSLIVAPEYCLVSSLLPLFVLSGGLLAGGFMLNVMFMIKANTKVLIYPKIVTAILGVVLNYLGAYFYGLIGVVVAGVAFPLVYFVWIVMLHILDKNGMGLEGK
ncbi:MAG: oligosaccharide flippase family protein [Candidatus Omnitrophota bacterium]